MIVGFVGFGAVSKKIFELINGRDIKCITSQEKRSFKTIQNIKNSNICVLDTFKDVASKSDILISATSPKNAISIAENYARYLKGIYLDLNNISPDTTCEINQYCNKFVDGAIIGKIDSSNPILYVSGEYADELLFLNKFITTKKISDKIGDASILKMLRSSYTKTLSAVLIESLEIAEKNGLKDEFFDVLSLTEGDEFKNKSLSRINNTLSNSKRKSEELLEIIKYFDEDELIMVEAALKKIMQY